MADPGNCGLQPVSGQIGYLRRIVGHFIGIILLLTAAFLAPLAEFLERFVCTDIIDVIVSDFSHSSTSP
ncbi:hypothetical protein D3C75_1288590 [compost metagenome]